MYYKGKTDKGGTVVCSTAEQKRMLERIAGKIQWEAEAVIPKPGIQGVLETAAALEEAAIRKAGETQTGADDAAAADTAAAPGNSDLAGAQVDPQPQETAAPEAPRPENGNGGKKRR